MRTCVCSVFSSCVYWATLFLLSVIYIVFVSFCVLVSVIYIVFVSFCVLVSVIYIVFVFLWGGKENGSAYYGSCGGICGSFAEGAVREFQVTDLTL